MRAMRKFLVASLALGLGLGACGGNALEGEMKDWRDKMCKCSDKACAEKTMDDYRAWQKSKRDVAKDMSKGDLEKLMGIEKELKDCRRKLRDSADAGGAKEGADKPADEKPAADKPADK
jgi:hypothetical protein